MNLNSPFTLPNYGDFLPTRILPGPMEGVTEGEFLRILTRHRWVRVWWTPFLRISVAVPHVPRLRNWLAPYLSTGMPVLSQLMGTDSQRLAKAAAGLRKLGAAAIDLNCACPSPIVVGNGAGGARLGAPEWIGRTIEAMKAALDCPLGVKLRMGLQDPAEFRQRIAPVLRTSPPDFVTVHFRTVQEGYRPIPDGLSRLAAVREAIPDIPLVGSGDLFTPEDALNMQKSCGVDAVAPARGLLRNPRLLADLEESLQGKTPPHWETAEKNALLREFQAEGAHAGVVLQMAANLFGRDSDEFHQAVRTFTPKKP